ncbi:type 1 glutamine amidotransferase [Mycolicibacterium komossense]|uniref:Type 1 glutamine amidotransferase n=1 Tax=Mycolicibacterium komossense TaxID=1779 RepID=A0ABT3C6K3_9MYCO|nr:type 1 glutamine amidotransferase [Mycolicibacterium komossense]MCV7225104.1 type 1 glutamine amidotransferase [Mycolicibacterium komossense]
MARKVLFIYNDPDASEALLGDVFVENGFDIDTCEAVPADRVDNPAADVEFPDPTGYDVIVPLGSRWSVYDDALRGTWVGDEMQLIRKAADAGVGVLGVCFGGQLIAQALGGTVGRSPAPELGWYHIDSDSDFVPSGPWFEWHSDRFTLPPGATEVARNAQASQAFVIGPILALQFHPELDSPLLECWLADQTNHDVSRFGVDIDELRIRTALEGDAAAARVRTLVTGFLDQVAHGSRQS